MVKPKIEERTLYHPIISYLQNIGFKAVGETKVVERHPDILFQTASVSFVVEVKIGKPEIGLKAVAQASDYAKKLGTQNIIILIYPEEYRNQPILYPDKIAKLALNEKITALVLTEYWTESLKIEPKKLFELLKDQISRKQVKVDFKTIVQLIERYVKDFNSIVYQIGVDELVPEVVNKLDLFASIGEIKDKETTKRQVINLASFLLFNQLLFYHIYKKRTQNKDLPELQEINKVKDLQEYFDKITKIDYRPIYEVNILGHIPEEKNIIDNLNELIKAIKLLRAEHITHDLAGRFFHDLIPFEVRKVLAAFYTHPIAAELLAGLTINSWDETVIDPACGSGTLLVAAYRRKQKLYQKLHGYKNFKAIHKKFIEEHLIGIDLMPFAAHITAINLTTQNIEQATNILRISTQDSLGLFSSIQRGSLMREGIQVSPYSETIQKTLFDGFGIKKTLKEGAISLGETKESKFHIKPVDVVIMNPPFSDREKMPPEMRQKLKNNPLGEICGHQINLWGYFIVLAHLLLKQEGRIGVVIPINIARGKATEKIRNFLLENYHIEYIIKPIGDMAFSESSAFRDVLFIAKKEKPKKENITKVVFLTKSIKEKKLDEVGNLISVLQKKQNYSDENIEIRSIKYEDLISSKENLMGILSQKMNVILELVERINNSEKLTKIQKGMFPEGFHASPKGLSQLLFITAPITEDRIKRSFLILKKEDKEKIIARIKDINKNIVIPRNYVYPALRTITGINTIRIKKPDYFIISKYKDFNLILNLSKWDKRKAIDWDSIKKEGTEKKAFLLIPERFNPYSKNTHLLAFVAEEKMVCPHAIRIGQHFNLKEAKIHSLFINSTIFLAQLFLNKEETTGEYLHIMESDLILMSIFDLQKFSLKEEKILLELFEKFQDIKFPSILEQIKNHFGARIDLDKAILKILGFSDKEINEWLPKIYNALVEELETMKSVE